MNLKIVSHSCLFESHQIGRVIRKSWLHSDHSERVASDTRLMGLIIVGGFQQVDGFPLHTVKQKAKMNVIDL
jgi:hypothetical protein